MAPAGGIRAPPGTCSSFFKVKSSNHNLVTQYITRENATILLSANYLLPGLTSFQNLLDVH